MPSASSTSADPDDDDAARLPCLTTREPGPGDHQRRHRGDVHGVRAVAAGPDDVDGPARAPRYGTACSSIASARPGELLDGLALGAQRDEERRRAAPGVAAPVITSSIAHAVSRGGQVLPADERREQVGPGVGREVGGGVTGRKPRAHGGVDGTAEQPRDGACSSIGSSGLRHDGVGERPRRQPRVLRAAGEDQHRRAPVDLVLELAAQTHAAGLVGLAVEDEQVEPAASAAATHRGVRRDLDPLDVRRAPAQSPADGEQHLLRGCRRRRCRAGLRRAAPRRASCVPSRSLGRPSGRGRASSHGTAASCGTSLVRILARCRPAERPVGDGCRTVASRDGPRTARRCGIVRFTAARDAGS